VRGFDLHRLIVRTAQVFRGIDDAPILVRRSGIDDRTRNIWLRAGRNLIPVHAYVQTVRVHSDVAQSQGCGGRQFPLDRDIPLRRLRIAVARIGGLLQRAAADLYKLARSNRVRPPKKGQAVHSGVLVCVDRGLWITLVVVLQLPHVDNRENPEAGSDHCLVVLKWTECQADTGVEVAKIGLPQAGR
jgi:hypothetical protein